MSPHVHVEKLIKLHTQTQWKGVRDEYIERERESRRETVGTVHSPEQAPEQQLAQIFLHRSTLSLSSQTSSSLIGHHRTSSAGYDSRDVPLPLDRHSSPIPQNQQHI